MTSGSENQAVLELSPETSRRYRKPHRGGMHRPRQSQPINPEVQIHKDHGELRAARQQVHHMLNEALGKSWRHKCEQGLVETNSNEYKVFGALGYHIRQRLSR